MSFTLQSAVESGNIEKLTELLNGSGCDVNSADKDGYTALHFAAALNEVQCAMLLVKYGADVNAVSNKSGTTPLHEAVRAGNEECVKLLLQNNADVNRQDGEGWAALHYAALQNKSICLLLLDQHPQIDLRNFDLETPLHIAATKGDLDLVSLFIQRGAELSNKDSMQNVPLGKLILKDLPKLEDKEGVISLSNRSKELAKNMKDLQSSKLYSDVEFELPEGTVYQVHKAVIATRCLHLKKLLEDESNATKSRILITDTTSSAFGALLEWIYSANIEKLALRKLSSRLGSEKTAVPPMSAEADKKAKSQPLLDYNFAFELYDLAIKYDLKSLRELCEMAMMLSGETKCQLSELACNLMVQQLMTPTTPPNFATFCANFLVLNFDLFTTTKAYEKFNADNFQLLISKLLVEKNDKLPEAYLKKSEPPIKKSKPVVKKLEGKNLKLCKGILAKLMKDPGAIELFNEPVDPIKWNIPDYPTIIKHPMDFGTIQSHLDQEKYSDIGEFITNVRLVFQNALVYNGLESAVGKLAIKLKDTFESRVAATSFGKGKEGSTSKKSGIKTPNTPTQLSPQSPMKAEPTTPLFSHDASKKRKADHQASNGNLKRQAVKQESLPQLTFEDKKRLCNSMGQLTSEQLLDALDILNYTEKNINIEADTLDIDMNQIDDATLHQLDKFINQCLEHNKTTR